MPTVEQMEAGVRAYIDSYNRADLDGIVAVFASDATVEDPVGTPPKQGHEALRAFFQVGVEAGAKLFLDGPIRCAYRFAVFPFHVELTWDGAVTRIDVIDQFEFGEQGKVIGMKAFFGPANMGPA